MKGAKIYNLGLSLLIRLSLFVDYLSFLGGETQRPYLKTHSRVASVGKSIPPISDESRLDNSYGEDLYLPVLKVWCFFAGTSCKEEIRYD